MMQRKQFIPLMLALASAAHAAELGDIAPRSYIGQPLAVDIELVSLTPEEAVNLPVRLAQADVYRAANAAINPALASVRMQVEKRGQKQILHVTTTRAVEAEYLHLYVELGAPGKSEVRLATVWLQRDPNPPPPPAPVQVAAVTPASAMTPAQAEQIAAQARAARVAAAEAAKAEAAKTEAAKAEAAKAEQAKAEAARERAKPAPLPSVHEAETGKPGEIKAAGQARRIAGILVGSDGKPVAPSAREEAAEVPVGVSQALLPLAPLPLPKGVKRPAPASCAPTGMSAKECVALDARNTEMASKITELEGKLRALQGALTGAAPSAASAAQAAKPAVPAAAPAATAASQAAKSSAAAAVAAAGQSAKPGEAEGTGHAAASHAASGGAAEKAGARMASAGASAAAAGGAPSAGDAGGKSASSALASASLSAQGETEAHAAKAEGAAKSASASSAASGEAAASAASSVPTKQVRVLPKLKYKKEKEKPAEQSSATLPLIGGAVGLLALLGGGFVFLRKRSAGKGPLKIWQGFRKKKADEPAPEPATEPASESVA